MSDEREFRVYASEQGDEAVASDIIGDKDLKLALDSVRKKYPKSMLVVREVLETVVEIHFPGDNGNSVRLI